MKNKIILLFVILIVGCGEESLNLVDPNNFKDDQNIPIAVPCVACHQKVSKKALECKQCGHPTHDSLKAYFTERKIKEANAREQQILSDKLVSEAKQKAQSIGLDDYMTIILARNYKEAFEGGYTILDGWFKTMYEDQIRISSLFNFVNGKQEGSEFKWYKNGQRLLHKNWKDGLQEGTQYCWHENGKLSYSINYKQGRRHGVLKSFYDSGEKEGEYVYRVGKCISIKVWKPSGELCQLSSIDASGDGLSLKYAENEKIIRSDVYKGGVLHFNTPL